MLGLAWKFIRFDRAKSIGIITAIVISIFLIGQQLGLLFFLMGLMGNLAGNADTAENQLWVIERQSTNINAINTIDQRFVQQLASIPGVLHTEAVVIAPAQATFADGNTAAITLVGAAAPRLVMGPTADRIKEGNLHDLMQPQAVSAEHFSAKAWKTAITLNKPLEINGKRAQIKVITSNAQAFGASLMYTNLQAARFYGNIPPSDVSIIVLDTDPEVDKSFIQAQVNQLFPNLRAWDIEALKQSTVKEILISSNMGMSFGTLVLFAMISGFFIIGLTLYSSALDRLKDYGTLKAIGAKNSYVNKLIMAQAFLYAVIGYLIAMALLYGFKIGVADSGLAIAITAPFAMFLLAITLLISIGGSLFAVRKVSKLEPASVF